MSTYSDDELACMHGDGEPCPDDDRAREVYAALDRVGLLLRGLRDPLPVVARRSLSRDCPARVALGVEHDADRSPDAGPAAL